MFVFSILTRQRTMKYGVTSSRDSRPPAFQRCQEPGPVPPSQRRCSARPPAGPQSSWGSMSSPGCSEAMEQTLLVGNLESRVREEILYELFLQVADGYSHIPKCSSNAREEKFHQWDAQLGELDNRGHFKPRPFSGRVETVVGPVSRLSLIPICFQD